MPIAENLIGPERLQLHNGFLYFADSGDSAVCVENQGLKRVPIGGGTVETIVGGVTHFDAVSCRERIDRYWVEGGTVFGGFGDGYGRQTLFTASVEGGTVEKLLNIFFDPDLKGSTTPHLNGEGPRFGGVFGDSIFFNNNFFEFWRIPRTGGTPEHIPSLGLHWIRESVQDADRLYLVNNWPYGVVVFDASALTMTTVLPWDSVGELALDSEFVYFHPSDATEILQIPKAGGLPVALVHATTPIPEHCFASNSSHLFYLDGSSLMRVPVEGGSSELVSPTNGIAAKSMVADSTFVYIADMGGGPGAGRIWRFPKEAIPPMNPCSDINRDGRVDELDLLILLSDWQRVSGP